MNVEENEISGRNTPQELVEAAKLASYETLPAKSKERYDKAYSDFKKWQNLKKATNISVTVVMAYFHELAQNHQASTLWSYYSMLKATIKVNENIDIGGYFQLTAFLKQKSSNHVPVKARIFSEAEIQKFIENAPDEAWLDVKVVCIFGVLGGCRTHELSLITTNDIENHGELILVRILTTKTKVIRSFTITGQFRTVVDKYTALRRPGVKDDRFFVNFQRGRCTKQIIGKHKFSKMPRRIATYLDLAEPERYTGHAFRRTSATILANTGASIDTIKRHGAWRSSKVAAGYIEDSVQYKKRTGVLIANSISGASSATSTSSICRGMVSDNIVIPTDMVPANTGVNENMVTDQNMENFVTDENLIAAENVWTQSQAENLVTDEHLLAAENVWTQSQDMKENQTVLSQTYSENRLARSVHESLLKSLKISKCKNVNFTFKFSK